MSTDTTKPRPTSTAHVTDVRTIGDPMSGYRWHWRCSCKATGKPRSGPREARNGGVAHVRAMERAR